MPEDHPLPAEVLMSCVAVREAERLRVLSDGEFDIATRGWQQDADRWAKRMEPGDELWSWSTPAWTWQSLCGRGGLAIVRNGKPVDYVVTVLN